MRSNNTTSTYSPPLGRKGQGWRRIIFSLLFISLTLQSTAQESTTANLFGLGSTHILDTYISQEKYSGLGFTYLNIREREKPEKRWGNIIEHELSLSSTEDRSKKTSELEGGYNLYWGRYRQWHLFNDRLKLQAGGLVNAAIGFIYHTTTSNNPAQARLALNVMPAGVATYHLQLWKQHFNLRYELNLPLAGVMFSPNYGQSYYEIFSLGNYDHNIVPTTFVSAPTFRQLFTLDWYANNRIAIRVGYLGNYQQAAVNNLKQHIYVHRIMIGFVVKK